MGFVVVVVVVVVVCVRCLLEKCLTRLVTAVKVGRQMGYHLSNHN